MNRTILVNGLAVAALLIGGQQVAVADGCTDAWNQSSASKTCGSNLRNHQELAITDLGNGQCQIKAMCSTDVAQFSYPNDIKFKKEDVPIVQNCGGRLVAGNCD